MYINEKDRFAHIYQTQQQLEGLITETRSRSSSINNELKTLKCRARGDEQNFSTTATRQSSISAQERKRRSLNLSFGSDFTSTLPETKTKQSLHNRTRSSISDWNSNVQINNQKVGNRRSGFIGLDSLRNSWAESSESTNSDSNRSSGRWSGVSSHSNEQDRILRERLSQLARSENEKLDQVEELAIPEMESSFDEQPIPEEVEEEQQEEEEVVEEEERDIYVISQEDLDTIPTEIGPSRPGDINGTVLSWQMSSDLLTTGAKSIATPSESRALLRFLWAMFSNSENFQSFQLLPPAEVVKNLTSSVHWQRVFHKLGCFVKSALFTSLGFSVVFLQMILLGLMVVVYVIGDIVFLSPGKALQRWYKKRTSKPQLASKKRKLRKVR